MIIFRLRCLICAARKELKIICDGGGSSLLLRLNFVKLLLLLLARSSTETTVDALLLACTYIIANMFLKFIYLQTKKI